MIDFDIELDTDKDYVGIREKRVNFILAFFFLFLGTFDGFFFKRLEVRILVNFDFSFWNVTFFKFYREIALKERDKIVLVGKIIYDGRC